MKNYIAATILCSISISTLAKEDHPLFGAYPGAELYRAQTLQYETFELPVSAPDAQGKIKTQALVGDLHRHYYTIKNVSTLKLNENLREAAKKGGFKTVFSCDLAACGDASVLGAKASMENTVYNNYHKPYYFVGERSTPKGKIYAAWFVGGYETDAAIHQIVLEETLAEKNLISVNTQYLEQKPASKAKNTPPAADLEKDHPLLSRYPGAALRNSKKIEYEAIEIPLAPADKKPALKLKGDLARHFYTINNTSTLKVHENYASALKSAGFEILSACSLKQCGDEEAVRALGGRMSIENSVYNWYHNPYYLVARKQLPTSLVTVALFFGGYEQEMAVQQIVLESVALETDLIKVDADTLKQQLDSVGKALIYGIFFDTGKAEVKADSKPTLEAIAKLLNQDKKLKLYVVGHTDDTGSGKLNQELSRQRAASVVAALTKDYRIAADRLQAEGVGPFAPEASNANEAGRKVNRRVELVKRLN